VKQNLLVDAQNFKFVKEYIKKFELRRDKAIFEKNEEKEKEKLMIVSGKTDRK